MKRRIIVAIVAAAAAAFLGISSGVVQPVADAVYCAIVKDDCK